MKKFIKDNMKIKLISVMCAAVLWMYVMAIVDPEETKLVENVSIRIENKDELKENDLIVYKDNNELVTDVYVSGNLSNIKSINKKDIMINGKINDPIEGINEVYLSASTPQGVDYKFKERVKFINLEKVIEEQRNINIIPQGKYQDNVGSIKVQDNKETIKIVGPRSIIENVDRVEGYVNIDKNNDISQEIALKAIDFGGNVIEGVSLEQSNIKIDVIFLNEKEVPVKLNIENQEADYELTDIKIRIKGINDELSKINFVETEPINISEIINQEIINVKLKNIENINLNKSEIEFKVSDIKNVVKFEFIKDEIEVKDGENLELPNKVILICKYDKIKPTKSDIKLYIDKGIKIDSKVLIEDVILYEEKM